MGVVTKLFHKGLTDSFKDPNQFISEYEDFKDMQDSGYNMYVGVFLIDSIQILGNLLSKNYWFNVMEQVYFKLAKKEGFQFAREYMVELDSFLENNLPK